MNRIIPAGCLAALFLAGCNSPSQHTPVPRNYGAASDVAVIWPDALDVKTMWKSLTS